MEVLQPQSADALTPCFESRSNAFSGTEGVYMLPHHQQEIDRLQRQHRFMKGTTDGALLVTPLPTNQTTLRVLDSGCADGTWLLDLKTQHPTHQWELHGVDIGSSLFPPNRPELDLRKHDIREPFPSAWQWSDHFDVIHQRLLIWGLAISAWPLVLRNQFDALKPGGWIQLVEVEWIDAEKPHSLPELHKHALMQKWSTSTFGMDIGIAYKVGDLLTEAGFINVQKTPFAHGYGALARRPDQKDGSAELYVECFRSIDSKMPPGMVLDFRILSLPHNLRFSELPEIALKSSSPLTATRLTDGIPGVAKTPHDLHQFLDRLEVEIKTHGYQPNLNFVYAQKAVEKL